MKELNNVLYNLVGKRCKLVIKVGFRINPSNKEMIENLLTYQADILDVSETHVLFVDKFNKEYMHLISNVVEASEITPTP